MNKKYLIITVVASSILATTCLVSGIFINKNIQNNKTISKINGYLETGYKRFKVEVVETKNTRNLTSNYEAINDSPNSRIKYDVTKYQYQFEDSSDEIIKNSGEIFSKEKFDLKRFKLNKSFKKIEDKNDCFKASLENAKEYLGLSYNCNYFSIKINYSNKIDKIEYRYTTDNKIHKEIKIVALTI